MIHFSKNHFICTHFLTHAHSPRTHRRWAHPGALAGSCARWDQGYQMPSPHRTSWVPLQWQTINFWAGLLPSWGANCYYGMIPLPRNLFPHSLRALRQVAAQCFFSLVMGALAPTVCPPAGRGGGGLAHRMCCDLAVILLLLEHSFFPKESSAQGLYQHPCLLLTSHPYAAYQGAGCQACRKHHICQRLPSFSAVGHIVGYQYRPFF